MLIAVNASIAQIIITGVMRDPKGNDNIQGGTEYVQLMATREINFDAEEFSVILGRNGSLASEKGWIGPVTSYKFNLQGVTVQAGEFFYIGGAAKLINGNDSESMSGAKWARSKDITTLAGDDGQGAAVNSATGFFPGSNPAVIGVFATHNVTTTTRPIDMLVLSSGSTTITNAQYNVDATGGYVGYLLPDKTDYYQYSVGAPYYGQGNDIQGEGNKSYFVGSAVAGKFTKFVGVYDVENSKWTSPRLVTEVDATSLAVIESSGTTLPVSLKSFEVKNEGKRNLLIWSTVSENNNNHFDIYRKSGSGEFEKIETVNGQGTTSQQQNYFFTDNSVFFGTVYYKLVQVDRNGIETVLGIKAISADFNAVNLYVADYAENNLIIKVVNGEEGKAQIKLTDISGVLLIDDEVLLNVGDNVFSFNKHLNKGVYVLSFSGKSQKVVKKVLLK